MHTTKTFDAKAVATDAGEFTAIAAAYSVDRVNDQIIPGAFAKTIAQWAESGKRVPIHYNHESDPESIIGAVDPSTMRETDEGLEVSGKLDLANSAKAKEAWRAIRLDAMSLSFGYLVTEERKNSKGVNELHEIDLFEVSVVPGPANADTRFLSLKSIEDIKAGINELQKALDELKATATEDKPPVEVASEQTPAVTHQASDPEAQRIDRELLDALTNY